MHIGMMVWVFGCRRSWQAACLPAEFNCLAGEV